MANYIKTTDKEFTLNDKGQYHSFDDLPAIVYTKLNMKCWYKEGILHRDNELPAVEWGINKLYYINGKLLIPNTQPNYIVNKWGNKCTYNDKGQLHSYNDQPALVRPNGTKEWWLNGKLIRNNGLPAIVSSAGTEWTQNKDGSWNAKRIEYVTDKFGNKCLYDDNDKLHSYNDLPALVLSVGTKYWYKHGNLHRDNDLPAIFYPDGQTQHWVNGKLIKPTPTTIIPDYVTDKHGNKCLYDENKQLHSYNYLPAMITGWKTELWYKHGKLHRDNDLPAIVWADGRKYYYKDNVKYTPTITIPDYILNKFGNKCLYDENGQYHSYNDLPAIIMSSGTKFWYKHGNYHRENDLPAIVWPNGTQEYYKNGVEYKPKITIPDYVSNYLGDKCTCDENGLLHSYNDLPAVIMSNGTQEWHKHGKLHRDNDLPAVVRYDGSKHYYKDNVKYTPTPDCTKDQHGNKYTHDEMGKLHSCNDLPACIENEIKYWYNHGKIHRDNDLPAIVRPDGTKFWYQNDKFIKKQTQLYTKNKWNNLCSYDENGKLHSYNDKPALIRPDGTKIWYNHGTKIKEEIEYNYSQTNDLGCYT